MPFGTSFDIRDQPNASAIGPMVVDYLIAMFKSNEKDSIGPSYSPKTLVKWSRPPQQFSKNEVAHFQKFT